MTFLEILILLLLISITVLCVFIKQLFIRIADIKTARSLAFESQKGANLATKEDIAEITKLMETVKSEVSFENQRKKEFIEERKKRLLDVLYYVENILNCQKRLFLYVHNFNDPENLHRLNDEINSSLLKLTHESHIIYAEFKHLEGIELLLNMANNISLLASEMIFISHNVAICIIGHDKLIKESANNCVAFERAKKIMEDANKYINQPLKYKDIVETNLQDYILWLNKLFGKGLNFKYYLVNQEKSNFNAMELG